MQTGDITRQWMLGNCGKFNRGWVEAEPLFSFRPTLTIKIIINGFGVYAILFMLQVNFFFMVIFEKRLTYFM